MTSLYETAINGLGLGTKASDIDKMHKDRSAAGAHLEADLLLQIGTTLLDLESAERLAAGAARNLRMALGRFDQNGSVSNAEWLTHYAQAAEKHSRDAQAAYGKVGQLWRLYQMTQV